MSRWLAEHRWYRALAVCSWLLVVKNAILRRPIVAYSVIHFPPGGHEWLRADALENPNAVIVGNRWVE